MALKSFTVASIAAPPSSNSVAICSGSPAGLILLSDVVSDACALFTLVTYSFLSAEPQPAVSAATASASPMMRFMGSISVSVGEPRLCGPDAARTIRERPWT